MLPEKTSTKKEETGCKAVTHTDKNNLVLPTDHMSHVYPISCILCSSSHKDHGNENKG